MKRRGFLGLVTGAVAAGPSMAKDVVASLPDGLPSAVSYGGSLAAKAIPTGHRLGIIERGQRINELKRLISGDFTDQEREDRRIDRLYNADNLFAQNVTCLRSVSAYNKVRIHSDRMQAVKDDIWQSRNRSYLDRLLRGED